jgi:Sec-independent protein translocase protein TatA
MIAAIILITLLITINIILVWYVKRLLNIINDTTEGIKDMKEAINAFSEHLQIVYKQETYYGEPTIERLIKHSKILVQEMEQFIKVFLASDPQIQQQETDTNEKETKQDE